MLFGNAVIFSQPPFGLAPEVLDAVDMIFLVGKQFAVIDAEVMELRDIDGVIRFPAIGIDDGIGLYLAVDDRHQARAGRVRDDLGVDLAAALENAEDGDLAGGAAPAIAFAVAAEIALIQLDLAVERTFIVQFASDHLTQFMIIKRRRMPVDAHQFRRRSGRNTTDKQIQ